MDGSAVRREPEEALHNATSRGANSHWGEGGEGVPMLLSSGLGGIVGLDVGRPLIGPLTSTGFDPCGSLPVDS
jgi:hypothetical protein